MHHATGGCGAQEMIERIKKYSKEGGWGDATCQHIFNEDTMANKRWVCLMDYKGMDCMSSFGPPMHHV
jgi:hypothetical protein